MADPGAALVVRIVEIVIDAGHGHRLLRLPVLWGKGQRTGHRRSTRVRTRRRYRHISGGLAVQNHRVRRCAVILFNAHLILRNNHTRNCRVIGHPHRRGRRVAVARRVPRHIAQNADLKIATAIRRDRHPVGRTRTAQIVGIAIGNRHIARIEPDHRFREPHRHVERGQAVDRRRRIFNRHSRRGRVIGHPHRRARRVAVARRVPRHIARNADLKIARPIRRDRHPVGRTRPTQIARRAVDQGDIARIEPAYRFSEPHRHIKRDDISHTQRRTGNRHTRRCRIIGHTHRQGRRVPIARRVSSHIRRNANLKIARAVRRDRNPVGAGINLDRRTGIAIHNRHIARIEPDHRFSERHRHIERGQAVHRRRRTGDLDTRRIPIIGHPNRRGRRVAVARRVRCHIRRNANLKIARAIRRDRNPVGAGINLDRRTGIAIHNRHIARIEPDHRFSERHRHIERGQAVHRRRRTGNRHTRHRRDRDPGAVIVGVRQRHVVDIGAAVGGVGRDGRSSPDRIGDVAVRHIVVDACHRHRLRLIPVRGREPQLRPVNRALGRVGGRNPDAHLGRRTAGEHHRERDLAAALGGRRAVRRRRNRDARLVIVGDRHGHVSGRDRTIAAARNRVADRRAAVGIVVDGVVDARHGDLLRRRPVRGREPQRTRHPGGGLIAARWRHRHVSGRLAGEHHRVGRRARGLGHPDRALRDPDAGAVIVGVRQRHVGDIGAAVGGVGRDGRSSPDRIGDVAVRHIVVDACHRHRLRLIPVRGREPQLRPVNRALGRVGGRNPDGHVGRRTAGEHHRERDLAAALGGRRAVRRRRNRDARLVIVGDRHGHVSGRDRAIAAARNRVADRRAAVGIVVDGVVDARHGDLLRRRPVRGREPQRTRHPGGGLIAARWRHRHVSGRLAGEHHRVGRRARGLGHPDRALRDPDAGAVIVGVRQRHVGDIGAAVGGVGRDGRSSPDRIGDVAVRHIVVDACHRHRLRLIPVRGREPQLRPVNRALGRVGGRNPDGHLGRRTAGEHHRERDLAAALGGRRAVRRRRNRDARLVVVGDRHGHVSGRDRAIAAARNRVADRRAAVGIVVDGVVDARHGDLLRRRPVRGREPQRTRHPGGGLIAARWRHRHVSGRLAGEHHRVGRRARGLGHPDRALRDPDAGAVIVGVRQRHVVDIGAAVGGVGRDGRSSPDRIGDVAVRHIVVDACHRHRLRLIPVRGREPQLRPVNRTLGRVGGRNPDGHVGRRTAGEHHRERDLAAALGGRRAVRRRRDPDAGLVVVGDRHGHVSGRDRTIAAARHRVADRRAAVGIVVDGVVDARHGDLLRRRPVRGREPQRTRHPGGGLIAARWRHRHVSGRLAGEHHRVGRRARGLGHPDRALRDPDAGAVIVGVRQRHVVDIDAAVGGVGRDGRSSPDRIGDVAVRHIVVDACHRHRLRLIPVRGREPQLRPVNRALGRVGGRNPDAHLGRRTAGEHHRERDLAAALGGRRAVRRRRNRDARLVVVGDRHGHVSGRDRAIAAARNRVADRRAAVGIVVDGVVDARHGDLLRRRPVRGREPQRTRHPGGGLIAARWRHRHVSGRLAGEHHRVGRRARGLGHPDRALRDPDAGAVIVGVRQRHVVDIDAAVGGVGRDGRSSPDRIGDVAVRHIVVDACHRHRLRLIPVRGREPQLRPVNRALGRVGGRNPDGHVGRRTAGEHHRERDLAAALGGRRAVRRRRNRDARLVVVGDRHGHVSGRDRTIAAARNRVADRRAAVGIVVDGVVDARHGDLLRRRPVRGREPQRTRHPGGGLIAARWRHRHVSGRLAGEHHRVGRRARGLGHPDRALRDPDAGAVIVGVRQRHVVDIGAAVGGVGRDGRSSPDRIGDVAVRHIVVDACHRHRLRLIPVRGREPQLRPVNRALGRVGGRNPDGHLGRRTAGEHHRERDLAAALGGRRAVRRRRNRDARLVIVGVRQRHVVDIGAAVGGVGRDGRSSPDRIGDVAVRHIVVDACHRHRLRLIPVRGREPQLRPVNRALGRVGGRNPDGHLGRRTAGEHHRERDLAAALGGRRAVRRRRNRDAGLVVVGDRHGHVSGRDRTIAAARNRVADRRAAVGIVVDGVVDARHGDLLRRRPVRGREPQRTRHPGGGLIAARWRHRHVSGRLAGEHHRVGRRARGLGHPDRALRDPDAGAVIVGVRQRHVVDIGAAVGGVGRDGRSSPDRIGDVAVRHIVVDACHRHRLRLIPVRGREPQLRPVNRALGRVGGRNPDAHLGRRTAGEHHRERDLAAALGGRRAVRRRRNRDARLVVVGDRHGHVSGRDRTIAAARNRVADRRAAVGIVVDGVVDARHGDLLRRRPVRGREPQRTRHPGGGLIAARWRHRHVSGRLAGEHHRVGRRARGLGHPDRALRDPDAGAVIVGVRQRHVVDIGAAVGGVGRDGRSSPDRIGDVAVRHIVVDACHRHRLRLIPVRGREPQLRPVNRALGRVGGRNPDGHVGRRTAGEHHRERDLAAALGGRRAVRRRRNRDARLVIVGDRHGHVSGRDRTIAAARNRVADRRAAVGIVVDGVVDARHGDLLRRRPVRGREPQRTRHPGGGLIAARWRHRHVSGRLAGEHHRVGRRARGLGHPDRALRDPDAGAVIVGVRQRHVVDIDAAVGGVGRDGRSSPDRIGDVAVRHIVVDACHRHRLRLIPVRGREPQLRPVNRALGRVGGRNPDGHVGRRTAGEHHRERDLAAALGGRRAVRRRRNRDARLVVVGDRHGHVSGRDRTIAAARNRVADRRAAVGIVVDGVVDARHGDLLRRRPVRGREPQRTRHPGGGLIAARWRHRHVSGRLAGEHHRVGRRARGLGHPDRALRDPDAGAVIVGVRQRHVVDIGAAVGGVGRDGRSSPDRIGDVAVRHIVVDACHRHRLRLIPVRGREPQLRPVNRALGRVGGRNPDGHVGRRTAGEHHRERDLAAALGGRRAVRRRRNRDARLVVVGDRHGHVSGRDRTIAAARNRVADRRAAVGIVVDGVVDARHGDLLRRRPVRGREPQRTRHPGGGLIAARWRHRHVSGRLAGEHHRVGRRARGLGHPDRALRDPDAGAVIVGVRQRHVVDIDAAVGGVGRDGRSSPDRIGDVAVRHIVVDACHRHRLRLIPVRGREPQLRPVNRALGIVGGRNPDGHVGRRTAGEHHRERDLAAALGGRRAVRRRRNRDARLVVVGDRHGHVSGRDRTIAAARNRVADRRAAVGIVVDGVVDARHGDLLRRRPVRGREPQRTRHPGGGLIAARWRHRHVSGRLAGEHHRVGRRARGLGHPDRALRDPDAGAVIVGVRQRHVVDIDAAVGGVGRDGRSSPDRIGDVAVRHIVVDACHRHRLRLIPVRGREPQLRPVNRALGRVGGRNPDGHVGRRTAGEHHRERDLAAALGGRRAVRRRRNRDARLVVVGDRHGHVSGRDRTIAAARNRVADRRAAVGIVVDGVVDARHGDLLRRRPVRGREPQRTRHPGGGLIAARWRHRHVSGRLAGEHHRVGRRARGLGHPDRALRDPDAGAVIVGVRQRHVVDIDAAVGGVGRDGRSSPDRIGDVAVRHIVVDACHRHRLRLIPVRGREPQLRPVNRALGRVGGRNPDGHVGRRTAGEHHRERDLAAALGGRRAVRRRRNRDARLVVVGDRHGHVSGRDRTIAAARNRVADRRAAVGIVVDGVVDARHGDLLRRRPVRGREPQRTRHPGGGLIAARWRHRHVSGRLAGEHHRVGRRARGLGHPDRALRDPDAGAVIVGVRQRHVVDIDAAVGGVGRDGRSSPDRIGDVAVRHIVVDACHRHRLRLIPVRGREPQLRPVNRALGRVGGRNPDGHVGRRTAGEHHRERDLAAALGGRRAVRRRRNRDARLVIVGDRHGHVSGRDRTIAAARHRVADRRAAVGIVVDGVVDARHGDLLRRRPVRGREPQRTRHPGGGLIAARWRHRHVSGRLAGEHHRVGRRARGLGHPDRALRDPDAGAVIVGVRQRHVVDIDAAVGGVGRDGRSSPDRIGDVAVRHIVVDACHRHRLRLIPVRGREPQLRPVNRALGRVGGRNPDGHVGRRTAGEHHRERDLAAALGGRRAVRRRRNRDARLVVVGDRHGHVSGRDRTIAAARNRVADRRAAVGIVVDGVVDARHGDLLRRRPVRGREPQRTRHPGGGLIAARWRHRHVSGRLAGEHHRVGRRARGLGHPDRALRDPDAGAVIVGVRQRHVVDIDAAVGGVGRDGRSSPDRIGDVAVRHIVVDACHRHRLRLIPVRGREPQLRPVNRALGRVGGRNPDGHVGRRTAGEHHRERDLAAALGGRRAVRRRRNRDARLVVVGDRHGHVSGRDRTIAAARNRVADRRAAVGIVVDGVVDARHGDLLRRRPVRGREPQRTRHPGGGLIAARWRHRHVSGRLAGEHHRVGRRARGLGHPDRALRDPDAGAVIVGVRQRHVVDIDAAVGGVGRDGRSSPDRIGDVAVRHIVVDACHRHRLRLIPVRGREPQLRPVNRALGRVGGRNPDGHVGRRTAGEHHRERDLAAALGGRRAVRRRRNRDARLVVVGDRHGHVSGRDRTIAAARNRVADRRAAVGIVVDGVVDARHGDLLRRRPVRGREPQRTRHPGGGLIAARWRHRHVSGRLAGEHHRVGRRARGLGHPDRALRDPDAGAVIVGVRQRHVVDIDAAVGGVGRDGRSSPDRIGDVAVRHIVVDACHRHRLRLIPVRGREPQLRPVNRALGRVGGRNPDGHVGRRTAGEHHRERDLAAALGGRRAVRRRRNRDARLVVVGDRHGHVSGRDRTIAAARNRVADRRAAVGIVVDGVVDARHGDLLRRRPVRGREPQRTRHPGGGLIAARWRHRHVSGRLAGEHHRVGRRARGLGHPDRALRDPDAGAVIVGVRQRHVVDIDAAVGGVGRDGRSSPDRIGDVAVRHIVVDACHRHRLRLIPVRGREPQLRPVNRALGRVGGRNPDGHVGRRTAGEHHRERDLAAALGGRRAVRRRRNRDARLVIVVGDRHGRSSPDRIGDVAVRHIVVDACGPSSRP